MNLYWYKHKGGNGNFGDELNPYIVKILSGIQPDYIDITKLPPNKKITIKVIISYLLKGRLSTAFQKEHRVALSNQNVIVAIGSVISWYNNPNIIVWGAGMIQNNAKIHPADFRAVRGRYTLNRLNELGYNTAQTVLGDPALLLPVIFPLQESKKKYKIGIIPHYIHYAEIKKQAINEEVLVINLLDPIEKILKEIMSCELTLSSSLHGVIVSHAYGIPSLWTDFENLDLENLAGDGIKFADYFSSVSLPGYQSISIAFPLELQALEDLKLKHMDKILPNAKDIHNIQNDLLKSAPFKVKDAYFLKNNNGS